MEKMYKFYLPKGTGYYFEFDKTNGVTTCDHYTVVKYDISETVNEVLSKAKRQLAQQIAIDEMHNVRNWVGIKLDTDTIEWVGNVK